MTTVQQQSHSLSLLKLIENIDGLVVRGWGPENLLSPSTYPQDLTITGITQDSRQVKPGYLFAALKGTVSNGCDFIPMAIEKGAVAVLCEEGYLLSVNSCQGQNASETVFITHSNPKLVLALIAAKFYQTQPEVIAAVTGTNGKTSTSYFCTQIWQLLGKKSASMGTIGVVTSDGLAYGATGSMTTPDPIKLHEILADLTEKGIANLAMEASSHGLDQYRLDGVNLKAAAFTNLTRDHLDYHHTLENYLAAKLRLFEIMRNGVAVINADIPEARQIIQLCEDKGHKVLSIGKHGKYIELFDITRTREGQQIAFEVLGRLYTVNTHLIGEFQAYNLLTALALVVGCGENIDEAVAVLDKVQAVPGRMQGVGIGNKMARVYVDYAHTPDALEKALKEIRPYVKGKLWVVFGCGGDRDKGKRPQMGKVAENLADLVVVTDDNPRTEDSATIRSEIRIACPNSIEISDRVEAIEYAVSNMQEDDVLLLAGKGHEKTQIIGDKKMPFDDVKVVENALAKSN